MEGLLPVLQSFKYLIATENINEQVPLLCSRLGLPQHKVESKRVRANKSELVIDPDNFREENSLDYQIYEELAGSWWDEGGSLHLLKAMVNPWRVPYFADALKKHFGSDLARVLLLDVGCGGGVLTEEFARLGCQVTGVDLSLGSLETARAHAQTDGLSIAYQAGSATWLPFDRNSFEVVSCCDVLEHIPRWEEVLAEVGRVLAPGGLFLFDTINRTLKSRFAFIFGLQEWGFTRLFPRDTHIWEMFITPDELVAALAEHSLTVKDLSGAFIDQNPLAILTELRRYKRGEINVAELGRRLELKHGPDVSLNYLGYARLER